VLPANRHKWTRPA